MRPSPRFFSCFPILLTLFYSGAALSQPDTAALLLINEVDADQSGTDSAEFVELYDGGIGNLPLDDHVLVFYTGSTDTSYAAFDLDGLSTNGDGYFVLCANMATTPNCDLDVSPDTNLIQNGADAVALYLGSAAGFPNGTAVTTTGIDDALVYDTNDGDDAGLLALLNMGQPQVNEGGGGNSTAHSNQRCPDGSGGALNTDSYEQWPPTPGAFNDCMEVIADPLINEFVANHTGTDASEYVEIFGDADTDYSAFTLLEVEGDSGGTGTIDEVIAVGTTDANGFWDTGFLSNAIENGSVTLLLVESFSGMAGNDLDTDDDGNTDTAPWNRIVDCVAVDDGGASDLTYCPAVLDSTLPPAGFTPGGASRIPDGTDTDTAGDWARNDFDGAGIPALNPGTPDEGEAFNTPGATNALVPGEAPDVVINEVDADQTGTDAAEFVELYDGGAGNTALDGLVLVLFNGSVDTSYGAFDLDGLSTDGAGYFVLCGDAANTPNCDLDVSPDTNLIQNGADAVALYQGDAAGFPTGTAVTASNLLDALVYDTGDADDAGLLVLLNAGQPQVDEGASNSAAESNQRCPNGTGGARNTDTYEQWPPTPGAENVCMVVQEPPPVCGDSDNATLISAVQGSTDVSPFEGMVVEIEGIVVADLQGANEYGGLFVQEEDADADADALTSEGIFVFTSEPAGMGDHVRVRGTVDEFFNLTEISPATDVVICATGAALPSPAMPSLPMSAPDEFEAFESMSIVMPQPLVINETFTVFRFGELTVSSERLSQPTAVVAPGAPAQALAAANALDMLILDDRRSGQNLAPPINGQDDTNPLSATNTIRSGQVVSGLTGVMHFAFDAWRVQPVGQFTIDESGNQRTVAPAPVGGTLTVTSFNVLNFFTTLDTGPPACGPLMNLDCRGADSMEEYTRQLDKLVAALDTLDADVVGLIELENNASASLQALTDAVNAAAGAGTYDYIDTGTIGGDAIKVGFIYKPASVTPEGDFALLTSAVDARFDDSLNRPSLAQSFRATANQGLFTAIVNHLKSKGCGGASGAEADQGDGQGCWNPTRTSAAEALRDWANGDPTGTGTDHVLIIGDLNSYYMEDPIQALVGGGFTSLELAFGGPDAYTFVFDAQKGSLDYALSSAPLTPRVTGATSWHINADEPVALDYNTEFGVLPSFYAPTPYRSSDHDPVVVGLNLPMPQARATFLVTKDFDDDNPAGVEVTLGCNTGLPLEQSAMIAEGEHVEFVIGDFSAGDLDCTVSETVPAGYAPSHAAAIGSAGAAGSVVSGELACEFLDVSRGQFTCAITNALQAVDITIFKEWIDEHPEFNLPEFVEIELSCSGLGFVGSQHIAPGSPGAFSVLPHYEGTVCEVKEERQVGVITDVDDCEALQVLPGQGAECTVVNTRLHAGIPTLSRHGLAILALLMLAVGFTAVRRMV